MIYFKYERITATYPFHLSVGGLHQYKQNIQTIVEPKTDKITILFSHKMKQFPVLNGSSQKGWIYKTTSRSATGEQNQHRLRKILESCFSVAAVTRDQTNISNILKTVILLNCLSVTGCLLFFLCFTVAFYWKNLSKHSNIHDLYKV